MTLLTRSCELEEQIIQLLAKRKRTTLKQFDDTLYHEELIKLRVELAAVLDEVCE